MVAEGSMVAEASTAAEVADSSFVIAAIAL